MAMYTVRCCEHGEQDAVLPMEQAAAGLFACPVCGGPAVKVYQPPADHSENTWKAYYSDQLSTTADPVYVSSKAEYQRLKTKHGLQNYEAGMMQDKQRHRREEMDKDARAAFRDLENAR